MTAHDGVLLVDKHPGCTSHDVVQQVRRILRQKRIGHCGTLDPDATGLLLLTLGQATRLTRFLIHAPKVYEGTVRFGVATDTFDASGRVIAEMPIAGLSEAAVHAAMPRFVGTYEQTLPAYSAHKVGGVKLYELARRGEDVPVVAKEISVYEFQPVGPLVDGRIGFRLGCSSGTYARAIAHELGRDLGCGGHLASLRRVEIGPFRVASALPVDELARRTAAGESLAEAWIPIDRVALPFDAVEVDAQQERRLATGQTVLARNVGGEEGDWVRLVNRRGQLIAVGSIAERIGGAGVGVVQPRIVFKTGADVIEFSTT
ncbi:MAG: tRNA pseudouridine(55) synthase TruB [Thermoanaerobaculia bacterium]